MRSWNNFLRLFRNVAILVKETKVEYFIALCDWHHKLTKSFLSVIVAHSKKTALQGLTFAVVLWKYKTVVEVLYS